VGDVPARLIVTGRPLLRNRTGGLGMGEPVCLEIEGDRIASARAWTRRSPAGIGCPDAILAPALSDSHAHLVATASARNSLDLSEAPPGNLSALFEWLREHVNSVTDDGWMRVRGFDEFHLEEARPPTARELEAVLPGRPIRLRHATLHASVLSAAALRRVGPSLGVSEVTSDGLVVGKEEALTALCGPRPPIAAALADVGADLARSGIAWVDDITASNDAERVRLLADAVDEGGLPQRVRVWLRDADEETESRRAGRGLVGIAGVKLLPATEEETREDGFAKALARARRAGLPVAVHAVDPDVISGTLDGLEAAPPRPAGSPAAPDRLEHCSLCPPFLVERIAAAGVAVVTQPGFLVVRGPKYRRQVEAPLWSWLYPLRSLQRAGATVASGSDTPVIPPDPRLGFLGATTRRSSDGVVFAAEEAISEADALDLCTAAAARIRGDPEAGLPWWRVGARADLTILGSDPTRHGLAEWRAATTMIGGCPFEGAPS